MSLRPGLTTTPGTPRATAILGTLHPCTSGSTWPFPQKCAWILAGITRTLQMGLERTDILQHWVVRPIQGAQAACPGGCPWLLSSVLWSLQSRAPEPLRLDSLHSIRCHYKQSGLNTSTCSNFMKTGFCVLIFYPTTFIKGCLEERLQPVSLSRSSLGIFSLPCCICLEFQFHIEQKKSNYNLSHLLKQLFTVTLARNKNYSNSGEPPQIKSPSQWLPC